MQRARENVTAPTRSFGQAPVDKPAPVVSHRRKQPIKSAFRQTASQRPRGVHWRTEGILCSQIRHVVVDKISRLTDQKVRPDIPARKSVRKGAGGLLWQVMGVTWHLREQGLDGLSGWMAHFGGSCDVTKLADLVADCTILRLGLLLGEGNSLRSLESLGGFSWGFLFRFLGGLRPMNHEGIALVREW